MLMREGGIDGSVHRLWHPQSSTCIAPCPDTRGWDGERDKRYKSDRMPCAPALLMLEIELQQLICHLVQPMCHRHWAIWA